jgi:hypothetical protein
MESGFTLEGLKLMTKQSSEEPQQRRNMDIAEDHSAMTIPDDVMMKAHEVIGDIAHRGGVASHHGNIIPTAEGARLIARAILAEREQRQQREDSPLLPPAIPFIRNA